MSTTIRRSSRIAAKNQPAVAATTQPQVVVVATNQPSLAVTSPSATVTSPPAAVTSPSATVTSPSATVTSVPIRVVFEPRANNIDQQLFEPTPQPVDLRAAKRSEFIKHMRLYLDEVIYCPVGIERIPITIKIYEYMENNFDAVPFDNTRFVNTVHDKALELLDQLPPYYRSHPHKKAELDKCSGLLNRVRVAVATHMH